MHNRTEIVAFRVPRKVATELNQWARAKSTTRSDLLRQLVLNALAEVPLP
jgi:hypothetical protein